MDQTASGRTDSVERDRLRRFALLYAGMATAGLVGLLLPHEPEVNEALGWTLVVLAYSGAIAQWLLRRRVLTTTALFCFALGTIFLASLAVLAAGSDVGVVAFASCYTIIVAGMRSTMPRRQANALMAASGVACAVVLAIAEVPTWPGVWTILTGVMLGVSFQTERLTARIRDLALEDPLTGLPNRRACYETLRRELLRSERAHEEITVALIDLDGFKHVNDQQGHAAGDRLLRHLAAAWVPELRRSDVLARWGGDEFALLLPSCGLDAAALIVERLRAACASNCGFSAGLAMWDGTEHEDALISRADAAMYEAKRSGRGTCRRFETGAAGREAPEGALPRTDPSREAAALRPSAPPEAVATLGP